MLSYGYWKSKQKDSPAFGNPLGQDYRYLTPAINSGGDGRVFLLNMAPPESLGHAVSLVSVKPNARGRVIRCFVGFSRFSGHYQVTWLELGSLSKSDGLLEECF